MSTLSTPDFLVAEHQQVAYIAPYVSQPSQETKRLDDMHEGIKEFLDHELSFAPLHECQPKKILELGAGSGAWAIQAANEFPNAEILAVDLSPLPSRPLPSNMKFQTLNLLEPLPFEPETFDAIHERFVFMHLPNPEEVISRVIPLLRPGGWLLMEYTDMSPRAENGFDLGPATRAWIDVYLGAKRGRGADSMASLAESTIKSSGLFSEVHTKKIAIPISEQSNDPKKKKLGTTIKNSLLRGSALRAEQGIPGYTQELTKEFNEELNGRAGNLIMDMTFVWSCKRI